MRRTKLAITLEGGTVARLDRLVKDRIFPNRSRAIEEAVREKLERLERSQLARESAKLDRVEERALAEEGVSEELSGWPAY